MTKLFSHYLCGFDVNPNLGMTFGNRRKILALPKKGDGPEPWQDLFADLI